MTPLPPTRRDDVVDILHGVEVPDPYRWLEDGDAAEVRQWVAAQNAHTRQALDARPDRGWWHERLVALMRRPVVMAVQVRGDRLFCLERPAGAEQFVLARRSAIDPDAAPVLLLDPAVGTADAANAVDWFTPRPTARSSPSAPAKAAARTPCCGCSTPTDRSLNDDDPDTPGVQRGVGTRQLRLRVHPLPARRSVPPDRAPPRARRRRGPTTRSCWADSPTRRRGPTSRSRPMALAARPRASSDGARIDVHLLDRASRRWSDGDRGRRGHRPASGSPPTGHSLVGVTHARRAEGPCRAVPLDRVPPRPAGRTLVAEGDAVLGSVEPSRRRLLVTSTRRGRRPRSPVADDGTALAR